MVIGKPMLIVQKKEIVKMKIEGIEDIQAYIEALEKENEELKKTTKEVKAETHKLERILIYLGYRPNEVLSEMRNKGII